MFNKVRIFAVLPVLFISCSLHSQTCGGAERWQVKVVADSGSGTVELAPVQSTIQEALVLPQPHLPPQSDNDTRLPEERHVYQLRGHLVDVPLLRESSI